MYKAPQSTAVKIVCLNKNSPLLSLFIINTLGKEKILKELRHDILSHFFDGLNYRVKVLQNLKITFAKEEKHQRGNSRAKRNKDE